MNVTTHERRPPITEVHLKFDPLTVWLTPRVELVIEKGDTVRDIARVVAKYWSMSKKDARHIVAYWFTLGERAAGSRLGSPWKKRDKDASPDRVYDGRRK